MNREERRRARKLRRRHGDGGAVAEAAGFIDAAMHQALGFLEAGQPGEARRLYRQVLDIQDDHADALNLCGIASFQLGEAERALKLIRRAVAARPDHVDAHNNLGNVLRAAGRLDEAEAAYRRGLAILPDYVGGHFNLGIVLEAQDRPAEAEAAYRRALELEPDFAEAGLNLGNALKTMGRPQAAIDAYRAALELAPDHADGHNNLATALRELGQLDAAADAYRRALEIAPRHVDAHYNLGIVLQEQDRLEAAVAAYRRALEIDPGFVGAHVNLGYALQESGRVEPAIESYRRAIEIAPEFPGAHVNLGDALLQRGDVAAAAEACTAYLAHHPGDTAMLAWRAIVMNELGEPAAARELVDFDRFLRPVRVAAPASYPNLADFNAALAEHVLRHPTLVYAPARHATRFGKHSGELLAEPKGPVAQLETAIRGAVEAYMQSLPADSGHPFIDRRPRRFGLSAWCVILDRQGHQVPHIHPSAWASGVYYVRLPEVIDQAGQGAAGWIEFGHPPEHFHCAAEPELRALKPEPGLMFLFPSYFYHRTVPFESADADARISIAFDVLPEGRLPGS